MKLIYEENELITNNQFDSHIKLYEGYVNKVNSIADRITNDKVEKLDLRSNMESMQYALNGVILHELYFENIASKNEKNKIEYDIKKNFEELFNINYDLWKDDFITLALDTRGWVIFIFEPKTQQCINISLQDHSNGHVICGIPIIVLDMYEHAFYTDYKNDKKTYVDNFINNIEWNVVNNRTE